MATSTRHGRALQVWKTHGSMAPARAAQAIRLVGLPPDEETAVLAVDVHGQSCLQAAALLHVSVDGLAKIRRRAYAKIADDMQG